MSITDGLFGNYTTQNKKRITEIVSKTNEYKEIFESISSSPKEEEQFFLDKTNEFRKRLRNGESIESIMPEAFALCREATKRRLGMFHYDVQIEAAAAMLDNTIAEMKTGEGKTLVQILVAYINALEATKSENKDEWESIHVMTANDYLAKRDQEDNSKVYSLLGLTSGYVLNRDEVFSDRDKIEEKRKEKIKSYSCDIVYGTSSTFAFDYLDDNRIYDENQRMIRRKPGYAVVDEADELLLDQAVIPLVLSAPNNEVRGKEALYIWAANFINGTPGFRKSPVTIEEVEKYDKDFSEEYFDSPDAASIIVFKDKGMVDISESLAQEIYDAAKIIDGKNFGLSDNELENILIMIVSDCAHAKKCFLRDKQYQIFKNESKSDSETEYYNVVLVDQFTGRPLANNKYQGGIQEAIEALEECELARQPGNKKIIKSSDSKNVAKCTYPDFISLYKSGVSGMTGTSDALEFRELYGLETYVVPPRKPNIRIDEPSELYASEHAKFTAMVKEIIECQMTGQPVLIGTRNVAESNRLCKYLDNAGIRYQRLDAVNRENEDGIKTSAGLFGMVTVATNMAGRGIDIKLGDGVKEVGGLYVMGSSKNNNVRIDNQLRGRSARQGEPGKTKYFTSLEDEMVVARASGTIFDKLFERYQGSMDPIKDKKLHEIVDKCQRLEESHAKAIRMQSKEMEAKVFTIHKEKIYEQRERLLKTTDEEFVKMTRKIIIRYIQSLFDNKLSSKKLLPEIKAKLGHIIDTYDQNGTLVNSVDMCYSEDKIEFGKNLIEVIVPKMNLSFNTLGIQNIKKRMLQVIDSYWESHIEALDITNKTSFFYMNVDPKQVYEEESNKLFDAMSAYIRNEMITYAAFPKLKMGEYVVREVQETPLLLESGEYKR